MAPEERDRSFDKALARHLRSAVDAGQAAGMAGELGSQSGACPDPETLAAYHERSLLPEQLNSLKEHLVGCANCQTVLAHLESSDEIPLQAAEEDQVFAKTASAPVISASRQSHPPVEKTPPFRSRRARLLKGARWQWLAPAGALAAGLLVWIAIHENQPLPGPGSPENENKVAQNRVPAAPLPSVSTRLPPSSAPPKSAATFPPPKPPVRPYADSRGRRVSEADKQSGVGMDFGGKSLDDKELKARKDDKRETATDLIATANPRDLDTKNLPLTSRQEVQVQSQSHAVVVEPEIAQSQNALAQNQNNNAPQKATGPSPLNQAEALKKAKPTAASPPAPAAPSPQPQAIGGVASSYTGADSFELSRAISNPRLISPPGSRLIWRVGRSGLIEFSRDSGSYWSRQTSGILADLLTGAAPSDQVCWIVGSVGTILLTTDGGTHWKVVRSPLAEDLIGVRASDALHATIWNAGNRKGFETADGGLTWKPVAHP